MVPLGRRRAFAIVLEGVAVAVMVEDLPQPVLSEALRESLWAPWTTLIGPLPDRRDAGLHAAGAQ